jgi:transcriptional regulator with XRE-family HTH domain
LHLITQTTLLKIGAKLFAITRELSGMIKKSIGAQAQEYRTARGWSTQDMARAVGTNRQSIENLELIGDRRPRYIDRLAAVMGATVDELLAGRYQYDPSNPNKTVLRADANPPMSDVAKQLGYLFDNVTGTVDRAMAYNDAVAAILAVISKSAALPSQAPDRTDGTGKPPE